jgi:hypothetical protein
MVILVASDSPVPLLQSTHEVDVDEDAEPVFELETSTAEVDAVIEELDAVERLDQSVTWYSMYTPNAINEVSLPNTFRKGFRPGPGGKNVTSSVVSEGGCHAQRTDCSAIEVSSVHVRKMSLL